MLLPQSQAYKTLSDRLATVSSLHMNIELSNKNRSNGSSSSSSGNVKLFLELVDQFDQVQQRHTHFRLALLQQKNMHPKPNSAMNFSGTGIQSSSDLSRIGIES